MSKEYKYIKIPLYALVCKDTGYLAKDGSGGIITSNNKECILKLLKEATLHTGNDKFYYEIYEFEPTLAELV